jgi:hypothetical protein
VSGTLITPSSKSTVAYCDLRVIKECADIDQIAAVFD